MNIHVLYDIFTNKEREKLILDVQPLLQDGKYISAIEYGGDGVYPEGFKWFKLTNSTLNLHSDFTWAHDRIIEVVKDELGLDLKVLRSWINLTDGRNLKRKWHNHCREIDNSEYSMVYYIKTFPFFSNGTLFKDQGLVKAPENSLILFPSHLYHSTPGSIFRFKRYTMAFDLTNK